MNKRTLAYIFSSVFVVIGLLGFVNDPVLGLFDVDIVHNIVHLGSGLLGFFLASQVRDGSSTYGKVMAAVYGLVTIAGFILGEGVLFGLMEINMADNFLHLFLTAAFAYLGFAPEPSPRHQTAHA